MDPKTLLQRIQQGHRHNIQYADFIKLVNALGFEYRRTKGSHEIYHHPGISKNLNLQPDKGNAKPFQVTQLRTMVNRYNLTLL